MLQSELKSPPLTCWYMHSCQCITTTTFVNSSLTGWFSRKCQYCRR